MTAIQDASLRPDFRERARANDVPVARLIGFEAENIGEGRATVTFSAGPQHANPRLGT
jgi:acyl-coenzyme A thioesterase PaaI-like protein